MADRLLSEQLRVIDELNARTDAERRTWPFTAQLFIANLALALAPLVPRADRVFGALSGLQAITISGLCFTPVFISVFLYRKFGRASRWYRGSELLESFSLYSVPLSYIALSDVRWSVLWALPPFSALFFALTKPFRRRLYAALILSSHAALAFVFAVGGHLTDAAVSLAVGAVALAAFSAIARSQRRAVLAEADRNVALSELSERQLHVERARIASSLASGVAAELAALVEDLRAEPALALATAQAHAALLEVGAITSTERVATLPRSIDELASLLERKLKALCLNADYRQHLAGDRASKIDPATALAALRIAQELVRNAITHGAARTVIVELSQRHHELCLSVTDDGSGLRAERLDSSTGGLANVRRWAHERGGRLQRSAAHLSGTSLRVTMPLVS